MVLHTGGVTKRLSELEFIHNIDFDIIQVNDFRNQDKEFKTQIELNKTRLRRFLTTILYFFNFVVSANSDLEFDKVRPWTFSTRGHYFNRKVSSNFYSYLLEYLDIKKKPLNRSRFELAIHYRMGDLLSLSTKSITPANKIIDIIIQIKKVSKNLHINVYSDSPRIAKETLIQAGLTDGFQVKDLPTIDVIRACIEADYFIGTGSKVSLWIVNIRRYSGEITHNYLEGFDDKLFELP